jgi:hypothetical protein
MSMRKPSLLYSLTVQVFGSSCFEGGFEQAAKIKNAEINRGLFIAPIMIDFVILRIYCHDAIPFPITEHMNKWCAMKSKRRLFRSKKSNLLFNIRFN